MAKTKRDELLHGQIYEVIDLHSHRPRKEAISFISAICEISRRTAQQHYDSYLIKKKIAEARKSSQNASEEQKHIPQNVIHPMISNESKKESESIKM